MSGLLGWLGIQLPIIHAPMAGVSTPILAAAVSNAGALGGIAVGPLTRLGRAMIVRVRGATTRPFNVNVTALRDGNDRVVVGPATDGGYYLIGMNRLHPELFEQVAWAPSGSWRRRWTSPRARSSRSRCSSPGPTWTPCPICGARRGWLGLLHARPLGSRVIRQRKRSGRLPPPTSIARPTRNAPPSTRLADDHRCGGRAGAPRPCSPRGSSPGLVRSAGHGI
jgi:hypothetical protein